MKEQGGWKNPNCSLQETKFAYFRIRPLQHIVQQPDMTPASIVEEYQLLSNLQTDVDLVQSGDWGSIHINVFKQLQPSDKIKKSPNSSSQLSVYIDRTKNNISRTELWRMMLCQIVLFQEAPQINSIHIPIAERNQPHSAEIVENNITPDPFFFK